MNHQMGLNQMNIQNQLMYHNMGNISIDLNETGMGMQQMINPMSHSMNQPMEFIYGPNIKENDERKRYNSEKIDIIFKFVQKHCGEENPTVQCLLSEKVSELIQKYRNKTGDFDFSKRFIYNGKKLNEDLTVAEAGLCDKSYIIVTSSNQMRGSGCPMMFSDVSKNKTKEIFFSKSFPSYRKAGKGINIFGICHCKKCKAFNKEVVIPIKKKI